jgi:hypothetical protein
LYVDGKSVRFLLDCRSTVNLLNAQSSINIYRTLWLNVSTEDVIDPHRRRRRSASSTLRVFDNTILPTDGMLTAVVQHPTTKREMTVEFHIAKHHNQPILGLEACLQFDPEVVEENICAVQKTAQSYQPLRKKIFFQRFPDLFEGVECMPGEMLLDVDPHVRSVQLPLRCLPEAIKEQVRCELDRLCKDDIGPSDGYPQARRQSTPMHLSLIS